MAAWLFVSCRGSDEAAWQRFESSDSLFSVEFPGKPTVTSTPTLAAPRVTEVRTVQLDRGSRGMLQVSDYELLAEAAKLDVSSLLLIECTDSFKGSVFTPNEPEPRGIGGHAGLVVSGAAPRSGSLPEGGWMLHACLVVDGRMFQLVAVGPDDEATRLASERFLSSFRPGNANR